MSAERYPTEQYDLLNDYTKAVLIAAAAVAPTLVHGLYLKVSADSDVVLHRPDGHWVGLRLRTVWTEPTWEAWRGSLFGDGEVTRWPTLSAAVKFYATKTEARAEMES